MNSNKHWPKRIKVVQKPLASPRPGSTPICPKKRSDLRLRLNGAFMTYKQLAVEIGFHPSTIGLVLSTQTQHLGPAAISAASALGILKIEANNTVHAVVQKLFLMPLPSSMRKSRAAVTPVASLICLEKLEALRQQLRAAEIPYSWVARTIGLPLASVDYVFYGACKGRGPVSGKVAAALGVLKNQDPRDVNPEIKRICEEPKARLSRDVLAPTTSCSLAVATLRHAENKSTS